MSLHQQMLCPDFYPESTRRVEYRETHISRLYLLDRVVYKVKRPVDFGFLDFTTLPRRLRACQDEVRLNRRFSSGVYLGVVAIGPKGILPCLARANPPVEYAVRMKRLPEDRMLDRMLDRGEVSPTHMTALGYHLSLLHHKAPSCFRDEGLSDLMHQRRNWQENFSQTRSMLGHCLAPEADRALQHRIGRFFTRYGGLLRQREKDGWVREGHGDLHASHICLSDPIQLFDCIEFNRRFRVADIVSDLAFLLMDLQHFGHGELVPPLLEGYRAGPTDMDVPSHLLAFYLCYRAFVRGKVYGFQARQAPDQIAVAQRYFGQATAALLPPCLILVGGLMGTGKSTLCRALSRLHPCRWLRTDVVRKHLFPQNGAADRFGAGLYTPDKIHAVYEDLLHQTEQALRHGETVLVDASFGALDHRQLFYRLAEEIGRPVALVLATCSEAQARQRLARRQEEPIGPSDGRPELYSAQAAHFHAPQAPEPFLKVDTSYSLDYTLQQMVGQLLEIVGEIE